MSDTSQGPGWWIASDGKWYPPHLAPPPPPPPPPSQQANVPSTAQVPTSSMRPPTGEPHSSDPLPPERLVSEVSQGEGWWQATDGKWYAPELRPNDSPQGPDWWQASNGKWFAPMFHPHNYRPPTQSPPSPETPNEDGVTTAARDAAPTSSAALSAEPPSGAQGAPQDGVQTLSSYGTPNTMDSPGNAPPTGIGTRSSNEAASRQMLVSDGSQGEGWWQATDGKWYAPELRPNDAPQGPDWWQASNGKWFAPMFHPDNYPPRNQPPPQTRQTSNADGGGITATTPATASTPESPAAAQGASPAGSQGHPSEDGTMLSTSGSISPTRVSFIQAAPEQILVSDAPQGEGWWQATDAKWYAPEVYPSDTPRGEGWWRAPSGKWFAPMFHPNYKARTVTPSVAQMPNGGVGAASVTDAGRPLPPMTMMTPSSGPPPAATPPEADPRIPQSPAPPTSMVPPVQTVPPHGGSPGDKRLGMTPARWTYLAALVLSAIGLLLAWATASAAIVSVSVSGISTGDGKILGSIVLMAAATGWWRFVRTNRINGVLAIVLWVAIAAFAFAEIIHVNNVFAHASDVIAQVGVGLYLNAIAGCVGLVAAIVDTARFWSRTARV